MASPSMSVTAMATSESNEAGGGELQQQDIGSEEFDGLLHPNVLDTLADFDFSCADLGGGGGGTDPPQQQQFSFSPKVSGRKRSFTQACNWDNLGPKALSEISAGLLAGGWENGATTAPQVFAGAAAPASPSPRMDSFHATTATSPAAAPLASCFSPGRNFSGRTAVSVSVSASGTKHNKRPPATIGSHGAAADSRKGLGSRCAGKARRAGAMGGSAASGGGKKPLNPDRMERKASREKRRREEVNEKFEQLLQVLDDAEATSGLEVVNAEEGKTGTANACINGRRVEVLSRTIKILKKLLEERRNNDLAGGGLTSAAAAVSGRGSGDGGCDAAYGNEEDKEEEGSVLHSLLDRKLVEEEKPPLLTAAAAAAGAGAPPPGVSECHGALTDPAPATAAEENDGFKLHEAPAVGVMSASGSGATNPHPPLVHHMAMPVPGHHHAPIIMPPGFAGMSAPHGMPSHPNQPIFVAVPMYMPQGQGMGPHTPSTGAAGESAGQAPPAGHPSANISAAAAADTTTTVEAALGVTAEGIKKAIGGPLAKGAWAMPAGMGYPSMTTLQMPQFVAQALSSEEPDETPTHAVCA